MGIFKRVTTSKHEPTITDKAEILAFKARLKYGEDIRGKYTEARRLLHESLDLEDQVKEKLEEIFKFKKRTTFDDWTSFRISFDIKCNESPIGRCLYISYYGDLSPEKNDSTYCICCKEKLF